MLKILSKVLLILVILFWCSLPILLADEANTDEIEEEEKQVYWTVVPGPFYNPNVDVVDDLQQEVSFDLNWFFESFSKTASSFGDACSMARSSFRSRNASSISCAMSFLKRRRKRCPISSAV